MQAHVQHIKNALPPRVLVLEVHFDTGGGGRSWGRPRVETGSATVAPRRQAVSHSRGAVCLRFNLGSVQNPLVYRVVDPS